MTPSARRSRRSSRRTGRGSVVPRSSAPPWSRAVMLVIPFGAAERLSGALGHPRLPIRGCCRRDDRVKSPGRGGLSMITPGGDQQTRSASSKIPCVGVPMEGGLRIVIDERVGPETEIPSSSRRHWRLGLAIPKGVGSPLRAARRAASAFSPGGGDPVVARHDRRQQRRRQQARRRVQRAPEGLQGRRRPTRAAIPTR